MNTGQLSTVQKDTLRDSIEKLAKIQKIIIYWLPLVN